MTAAEVEAFVDAASAALALPIAAEHRAGVLHYFALAASFAELVDTHAFELHDEPGAVFTPVSPCAPDEAAR